MKFTRILCLLICFILLFQGIPQVGAEETQPSSEPLQNNEAQPFYTDLGTDSSITNGCRTMDGKISLWGNNRILTSSSAVMLYEINTDTVVYSWNADERMCPASLTKIMTALLAVEKGNLSDTITITEAHLECLPYYAHSLNLLVGEIVTLEQMLYCLMVGSANDAAAVISTHIAGSEEAFVELMNSRAKEIGCESTNFTSSHGLGHADLFTTARDMLKIIKTAIQNELFTRFFSASLYTLPATNLSESRYMETTNYLITPGMVNYYDKRVTAGRTGITDDRKRCLAVTAEDGDLSYIAVILEAIPEYNEDGTRILRYGNYEDMKDLLNLAFKNQRIVQVLRKEQNLKQYAVANGTNHIVVGPVNTIASILPADVKTEDLTYRYLDGANVLSAPVEKGQLISTVQLWHGDVCLAQTPVCAKNASSLYTDPNSNEGAMQINTEGLKKAFLVIGIILAFVLIVIAILVVIQLVRRTVVRAQHRRRRINRRRSR